MWITHGCSQEIGGTECGRDWKWFWLKVTEQKLVHGGVLEYTVNNKTASHQIRHPLKFIVSSRLSAEVHSVNWFSKKARIFFFSVLFSLFVHWFVDCFVGLFIYQRKELLWISILNIVWIQICEIAWVSSSRLCSTKTGTAQLPRYSVSKK